MSNIEVTVDGSARQHELIKAATYLLLKEQKRTMHDIAIEFGYTDRSSMYDLLRRWTESGVLEEARQIYLMPKQENIRAAVSETLDQWPEHIRRLNNIVQHGKEHNAILAFQVLQNEVVGPELAKVREPGSAEAAYANKKPDADPTIITLPAIIRDKPDKSG